MEFLDLFDSCLITVFSYCDVETLNALSQTCKRLEQTVEACHFPIFPKYVCRAGIDHAVIERFGKYIRNLGVSFDDRLRPLKINIRDYWVDYCEFLVRNVGDSIKTLEIISDGSMIPPLEFLAPILERLNGLGLMFQRDCHEADEIYYPSKKTYAMDLAALCPNLEELTFSGNHRFPPNCRTFSRLKSLTISSEFQHRYEIDEFLDNHPQLTQICFYGSPCDDQFINFDNLTRNMVNLEKLRIAVPQFRYSDGVRWAPHMLGRLQKLKTLRLDYVNEHFNEILAANLTSLTELTSITMYLTGNVEVTAMWQQAFVQIARDLKKLQFFNIYQQFTNKLFWDRNTVIDVVRLGLKLQAVHFQKLNFQYTADFLIDLVEARKSANPNAEPLQIETDDDYLYAALKVISFEIKIFF